MRNVSVVQVLKKEHTRLLNELHRVTAALTAFGKTYISGGQTKKSTVSAADRREITPAQKARRAKRKSSIPVKVSGKPKRTVSASVRRKIAAAQRARWAKLKG